MRTRLPYRFLLAAMVMGSATFDISPLPECFVASSFAKVMSLAVAPGALPDALATTLLPSTSSQVGPP